MKKKKIILSAPHVCVLPQAVDPGCDARSQDFARRLYFALWDKKGEEDDVVLVESDSLPRSVCDMNRFPCRFSTDFRQRLRNEFEKNAETEVVLLIDVHSFDSDYDWVGDARGKRGVRDKNLALQSRPDIVLLDISENEPSLLARAVREKLNTKVEVWRAHEEKKRLLGLFSSSSAVSAHLEKPLVYLMQGSQVNDILKEAKENYNVPGILIEFNEDLEGPSLDLIVQSIASALVEF